MIKYTQVQFIDENDKVIDEFTYAQPLDPEVREELKGMVAAHCIAHPKGCVAGVSFYDNDKTNGIHNLKGSPKGNLF